MTMIFCDGLDSYANVGETITSIRWTQKDAGAQLSLTGGRFGGGAFYMFNTYFRKSFTAIGAGVKIRTGFWVKTEAAGAAGFGGWIIAETPNDGNQTWFQIDSAGKGRILAMGSGAVLVQGTTVLTDAAWHWLEIEMSLATTATGNAQFYVDGILQGSVTNVITASSSGYAAFWSLKYYGHPSLGTFTFMDDIIIWNDQGTEFNTFPLGPQRITQLKPSGDGTPLQFTTNSGSTHYTQVNGGYGTTNYVEDAGTGNSDMYTYPALSYTPSTINAVVGNYWAQNPGSATANMIPKLKTSATTVSGTTVVLGSGGANSMTQQVWTKDALGAAWTAANVNAMQVGVGD